MPVVLHPSIDALPWSGKEYVLQAIDQMPDTGGYDDGALKKKLVTTLAAECTTVDCKNVLWEMLNDLNLKWANPTADVTFNSDETFGQGGSVGVGDYSLRGPVEIVVAMDTWAFVSQVISMSIFLGCCCFPCAIVFGKRKAGDVVAGTKKMPSNLKRK